MVLQSFFVIFVDDVILLEKKLLAGQPTSYDGLHMDSVSVMSCTMEP